MEGVAQVQNERADAGGRDEAEGAHSDEGHSDDECMAF
jgi:hypothetical protein